MVKIGKTNQTLSIPSSENENACSIKRKENENDIEHSYKIKSG